MKVDLKIVLQPGATMPKKAHDSDSCFDIYANEDRFICPGETSKIRTGIHIGFPKGWGGKIRPRSSWFSRGLNVDGTIDSGYTGEIMIIVQNKSDEAIRVNVGDRIAQLLVEEIHDVTFTQVEALKETERGAGGFGSTGI